MSEETKILLQTLHVITTVVKNANEAFTQGDNCEALINFAESVNFFKKIGNIHAMSICLNNIGNINLANKRYEEAVDMYSQSIKYVKKEWKNFRKKYQKFSISERVIMTDEEYR